MRDRNDGKRRRQKSGDRQKVALIFLISLLKNIRTGKISINNSLILTTMKNIFLTVISLNDGDEVSQERFDRKLTTFKKALKRYDAMGKRAEIKLTAHTKATTDEIRIQVNAEDELLRRKIYDNAALLTQ